MLRVHSHVAEDNVFVTAMFSSFVHKTSRNFFGRSGQTFPRNSTQRAPIQAGVVNLEDVIGGLACLFYIFLSIGLIDPGAQVRGGSSGISWKNKHREVSMIWLIHTKI